MRKIWVSCLTAMLAITCFSAGIVRATEYKFHVLTCTGTYKVYKAPWWELQQEYERRFPQHRGLTVSGFSDFKGKEIWYSEDTLDRFISKIPGLRRLYKHPLMVELENVSSSDNLVRAFIQDKEELVRINE
jgi:hypothetical protein